MIEKSRILILLIVQRYSILAHSEDLNAQAIRILSPEINPVGSI